MNRYADMTIWALREEMKTLQAELATRDVTPRPAQPVHATPETDAFYRKHPICEYEKVAHPSDCDAWLDFARDLERQLSLAQTENAGHIRIEDELKAELREVEKDAARYRWLRENSTRPGEPWSTHQNPESLDAAIDAAIPPKPSSR